jgi:hypothetical protein
MWGQWLRRRRRQRRRRRRLRRWRRRRRPAWAPAPMLVRVRLTLVTTTCRTGRTCTSRSMACSWTGRGARIRVSCMKGITSCMSRTCGRSSAYQVPHATCRPSRGRALRTGLLLMPYALLLAVGGGISPWRTYGGQFRTRALLIPPSPRFACGTRFWRRPGWRSGLACRRPWRRLPRLRHLRRPPVLLVRVRVSLFSIRRDVRHCAFRSHVSRCLLPCPTCRR